MALTKSKKTVPQETVQEQPITETSTEVQEPVVEEISLEEKLQQILQRFSAVKTDLKTLEQGVKALHIQYKQETKQKRKRKVERSSEKKGEFKAVNISPELAAFLGVKADEPMKRDQVSKMVYAYIKKNDLYFEDKPKTIMRPDAKLTKLFGKFSHPINSNNLDLGTGLSIYNMQKYLQQHFRQTTA